MNPHTAPATSGVWTASWAMATDSVLRVLRGEKPVGILNPEGWDSRRK